MRWNLAHKPAGTEDVTFVDVEAEGSRAAIDTLRAQIPENHVILYVRRVFEDAEESAATEAGLPAAADVTPGSDWSAV
jgi:hypothetical protein